MSAMRSAAQITCACGHSFIVQDDGSGSAHSCPSCQVANVLPRVVNGRSAVPPPLEKTADFRNTAVLRPSTVLVANRVGVLAPGTLLGPYRVVRHVGRGGMGSVYEGVDDRDRTRVALKVLSPELASRPDFVQRFHRESRVLGQLDDPRIARVFFSGVADGVPFFAMEFVDGQNLEEALEKDGVLEWRRAVHLMRETCRGLAAAAERGLIHRDVKPTNLLLDRSGVLKIVDFGLAKSQDSESRVTITGAVVGTPLYLSPEQGMGKPVDTRSDIYSLGATFYHLLTGAPPFNAESPMSVIYKHVHDPPEPLSKRARQVPEPFARVVMRCLAKDPARRYADWEDLEEDLDAVERGDPVSAPAETASIKQSKPAFVVIDEIDETSRVLRKSSAIRRALALVWDLGVLVGFSWLLRQVPGSARMTPFLWLIGAAYFLVGDALGGRTFGKRAFRLHVTKPDGSPPGLARVLLRAVFQVPLVLLVVVVIQGSDPIKEFLRFVRLEGVLDAQEFKAIVSVVVAIDILAALFNARGRSLHDVFSGTSVYREEKVKAKKKKRKKIDLLGGSSAPSPRLAAFLSVCFIGGGQLLNGEVGKGLLFLGGAVWMFTRGNEFIALAIWGIAVMDAFRNSQRRADHADGSGAGPTPPSAA